MKTWLLRAVRLCKKLKWTWFLEGDVPVHYWKAADRLMINPKFCKHKLTTVYEDANEHGPEFVAWCDKCGAEFRMRGGYIDDQFSNRISI